MTESSDFDLASLDAQDEMSLNIKDPRTGKETGWIWTFYGPGHPKTVELSNRVSRKALQEQRTKEQARVNNKKWKPEEQTLDELRGEMVDSVIGRVKTFTPVKLNGKLVEFSDTSARDILLDRRKGPIFQQITDFLRDDESFLLS